MQIEPAADREPIRKAATTKWDRSLFSPSSARICYGGTLVGDLAGKGGPLHLAPPDPGQLEIAHQAPDPVAADERWEGFSAGSAATRARRSRNAWRGGSKTSIW